MLSFHLLIGLTCAPFSLGSPKNLYAFLASSNKGGGIQGAPETPDDLKRYLVSKKSRVSGAPQIYNGEVE